MSKPTSLICYKRGLNNNIMQCKRYAPRLVSYGHACVTPTSGISNSMTFSYSYLFGYPGPRFFFATLSPSRGGKSRKTCGTRILLALVIEEVGRLGRSPSLLREGLYTTYLLVRARANLDSDALNKIGFTPLSTLSFSKKESLTI